MAQHEQGYLTEPQEPEDNDVHHSKSSAALNFLAEDAQNNEPQKKRQAPRVRPLQMSASSPNLGSTQASSRSVSSAKVVKSSPLRVKPPFQPPHVDEFGVGVMKLRLAQHTKDWDTRHQLLLDDLGEPMADNGMLPRGRRRYFAPIQTEDDLKGHLSDMMSTSPGSQKSLKSVRAALDGEKTPRVEQNPVTADVGPPILPLRHTYGGVMKDIDKKVRPWNDRWHRGIQQMNEGLHKSHRQYFVERSLFETSKSQRWRRYNDQQVGSGAWMPMATKKTSKFPPLGV